jgi:methionine synthase II (cobalamin-independent)
MQLKPTKGAIKDSLQNLAENLEQAYKQTMKRVQSQEKDHKELAEYVLQWIIYAKRPLSTAELPHAIAVRLHTTKLDEDYLPTVHTLLSVCAGLVRLEEKSRVIGLVHETTRAYFEKTKATWFPDAETNIATTCICRVEEGESTMQRSEQRVRKK